MFLLLVRDSFTTRYTTVLYAFFFTLSLSFYTTAALPFYRSLARAPLRRRIIIIIIQIIYKSYTIILIKKKPYKTKCTEITPSAVIVRLIIFTFNGGTRSRIDLRNHSGYPPVGGTRRSKAAYTISEAKSESKSPPDSKL